MHLLLSKSEYRDEENKNYYRKAVRRRFKLITLQTYADKMPAKSAWYCFSGYARLHWFS